MPTALFEMLGYIQLATKVFIHLPTQEKNSANTTF